MNDELQPVKGCRELEQANLRKLRAVPDRPRVLEYFEGLLDGSGLGEKTAKVVGQFCNLAPVELILAAGAKPVRLDRSCDSGVLADRLGVDLIVVPDFDEMKKLAGDPSSRHEVFVLEVPRSGPGEPALELWRKENQRLSDRLHELTGRKARKPDLKEAIQLVDRQSETLRKLNQLRREPRPALSGPDAFLVMQASFVADPGSWIEKAEILLIELEQRTTPDRGRAPRARVLLTGSPLLWPDYEILFAIREAGAQVVADDMCSASRLLGPPSGTADSGRGGLIRAALDRVHLTCFADDQTRRDHLTELVEAFRVDGIVCLRQERCRACGMDASGLSASFGQSGVPWLDVRGDVVRGQIEEFVKRISRKKP